MFPVVPKMGINQKTDLENKLKSLQTLDCKFRYQIRLGESDFRVFVKIYHQGSMINSGRSPLYILTPMKKPPNSELSPLSYYRKKGTLKKIQLKTMKLTGKKQCQGKHGGSSKK